MYEEFLGKVSILGKYTDETGIMILEIEYKNLS